MNLLLSKFMLCALTLAVSSSRQLLALFLFVFGFGFATVYLDFDFSAEKNLLHLLSNENKITDFFFCFLIFFYRLHKF